MDDADADLQRLHQQATKARSRRDCPTSETLARAAAGDLQRAERAQIGDHLGTCADCAEEYRFATSLKPWAESVAPVRTRRSLPALPFALATAAAVLISVSVSFWSYREIREARRAAGQAEAVTAQSRQEAAALRRSIDELSQPQVDMLIADLFPPDVTRGDRGKATSEQIVSIPANGRLFTLILNLAEPSSAPDYSLDIVNEAGIVVWRGGGLHKSRYNTVTLALPRTLLSAGRYRLVLKAPSPAGERLAQEYVVRLQYD